MAGHEVPNLELRASRLSGVSRSSVNGRIGPVAPDPNSDAPAGTKKLKGPAAAPPPPPQDYRTNQAYVYHGLRRPSFKFMKGSDLRRCACVISELPQPQSMSLVDLQRWVIKLLQLHPETYDLVIKGFFSKGCPLVSNPELLDRSWETHFLISDDLWDSYVKKVTGANGMAMFVLYVQSCEVYHYRSLFKNGSSASPQLAMGSHDCALTQVLLEEECLSAKSAAQYISDPLMKNPAMTTAEIAAYLAETYGKKISHAGAWRAKLMALEIKFGTFYNSYNCVPRWLMVMAYNDPDSFVDMKDTEIAGCNDFRVLHCIFWAFSQCIHAFAPCRPMLCIKSTLLCGKYHGVLLTAIALDANDDYIPVAFAIIEEESKENWLWFLRNVKQAVVKEQTDICIIHDYKRDLIEAINDLRYNQQEPHRWRDVQSRWCTHHLAENFFVHFRDNKVMLLFKRLCEQNQESKFFRIWKELDELTSKYTMEKEGSASREEDQELVEHDETLPEAQSPCKLDLVEDEEDGNHSNGNKISRFSDWVRSKSMEKWSLLYDTNGARYGIMGINTADVYNSQILKGIKYLPVARIVVMTFSRMVEYSKSRSVAAKKAWVDPSMNFPERVQGDMNAKMKKSQMHRVITEYCCAHQNFKVQLHRKQKHVNVCLTSTYTDSRSKPHRRIFGETAECSCNKPKLHHKPCSHVIAACCHIGVDPATYMSPCYSLSYLTGTWNRSFDVSKALKNLTHVSPRDTPTWIPNKKSECGIPAFLTSVGIQTGTDDEEQQFSAELRPT